MNSKETTKGKAYNLSLRGIKPQLIVDGNVTPLQRPASGTSSTLPLLA